jgi:N6-adenosine-specific RNA methylase IME4
MHIGRGKKLSSELILWDYSKSVEKIRPLILRWKNLTIEIVRELYWAREALRTSKKGGRPIKTVTNDTVSWSGYLRDIDLNRMTAHRWLEHYDIENDCLIDSKQQIEDNQESRIVDPQSGKYNIIYADPPWKYQNSVTRAAANNHYSTLSINELCELPIIEEIAADDSVLLMWVTFPFLKDSFQVLEAWGFEYKTVAFVWVKTNKNGSLFLGIGNYFRSNAEICLFGKRGKGIEPLQRPINTHIHKRLRHSQKPEIFKNIIVETFGDLPRIELFARGTSLGWSGWGYEA